MPRFILFLLIFVLFLIVALFLLSTQADEVPTRIIEADVASENRAQ